MTDTRRTSRPSTRVAQFEPDRVAAQIEAFNAHSEPERRALKYRAMCASSFAFFRGTAHLAWSRLADGSVTLPDAPLVWCTGDLHLQNFGTFRGENGLAYFDLNDFDEAALAPATWEVSRFVTSVFVAAGSGSIDAALPLQLAAAFLDTYRVALIAGKAQWLERATATGIVRKLLHQVKRRSNTELLDSRTTGRGRARRLRVDGRHALPATTDEREHVSAWMSAYAARSRDPVAYELLDVARRVAGTGSLGFGRFVLLVKRTYGSRKCVLLDVKEARPSTLAAALPALQPAWPNDAVRIVTIQRHMQAIAPASLRGVRAAKIAYVLRELQPLEDRIALSATMPVDVLSTAVREMARATAWAQLRSASRDGAARIDDLIAFARGRGWRRDVLTSARSAAQRSLRDWQAFAVARATTLLALIAALQLMSPGTPAPFLDASGCPLNDSISEERAYRAPSEGATNVRTHRIARTDAAAEYLHGLVRTAASIVVRDATLGVR